MSKATYFLAVSIGIIAGSVTTWKFVQKKYEKIAEAEIDSMKAYLVRKQSASKETPAIHEFSSLFEILQDNGYAYADERTGVFNSENEQPTIDPECFASNMINADIKPDVYVITPEEFGELDEYSLITLNYYADGYLVDEDNEVIEDAENIIGADSLSHFGEYEADSVFVRNDIRKCDYEILLDQRCFEESCRNVTAFPVEI